MGIQIEKGQEIAGYPALKIRNLLRGIDEASIRLEWLIEKGFSRGDAKHLLDALVSNELLHEDSAMTARLQVGPLFKVTEKGFSLIRASGAKRVHRETAQRTLEAFMDRVRAVNESPDYLVRVTEVVVFGSYLTNQSTLGDLDIACNYELKIAGMDQDIFVRTLQDHFRASGRTSKGIADYFWPWEQVKLFLKNRKRTISLLPISDAEGMIRQSEDFRFEVLLGDRKEIIARSRRS